MSRLGHKLEWKVTISHSVISTDVRQRDLHFIYRTILVMDPKD